VLTHHAGDLVAADVDATPAQLLPGLPRPVRPSVAAASGLDLDEQLPVGELATDGFRDLRA
jgi:hypothetical protein